MGMFVDALSSLCFVTDNNRLLTHDWAEVTEHGPRIYYSHFTEESACTPEGVDVMQVQVNGPRMVALLPPKLASE